ncbi:hypothetical protein L3X38_023610 [Prunus dulcis]|uniref:Uncharacterized protein n=1 Tax=Prunus dulcis TaxID=3755 RepID=A0AAD4VY54_PRUDU|nr:hypothetical protein L3X38_023610 [Prunus dulcis]
MLLFTAVVFGPPSSHPATAWGGTGPKRTVPPPSSHPNQSQPLEPLVISEKCKNPTDFNLKFTELVPAISATKSCYLGYPALGQTPYVALVVPAYGRYCDNMVEILGNVQFTGETLSKFPQKVSVFRSYQDDPKLDSDDDLELESDDDLEPDPKLGSYQDDPKLDSDDDLELESDDDLEPE